MAKVWREEAELPGVALSRPPLREAEPLRQQEELRSDGGLQEKAWVAGKCWAGFGVTAPGETPGRAQVQRCKTHSPFKELIPLKRKESK